MGRFNSRSQFFDLHQLDLVGVHRAMGIAGQRLIFDLVDGREDLKRVKVFDDADSKQQAGCHAGTHLKPVPTIWAGFR